jgi:MFS family permease|tara:strand:+ start:128 stop:1345 length:1218 start_codon:yes stop_codon:yes gene_type:complete
MPRILVLSCFIQMISMTGFAVWPIYLIDLQKEWNLTNSDAGWISGSFYLGYVLATPFLVSMTDTFDARKVYFFSSLLGCLGLLSFSLFASNAVNASICWSLVGAGLAGTYMPGLQILNSRLNKVSREKYVAIYTSFFGLGIAFSFSIFGILKSYNISWENAFLYASFILLMCSFPLLFFSGKEIEERKIKKYEGMINVIIPIFSTFKNKKALPFILGYGGHTYELFGFRSWTFPCILFLSTHFQNPVTDAFIANAIGLMGFLGIFASIYGARYCINKDRAKVVSKMGLICFVGSIITAISFWFSFWLALLMLFIYNALIVLDSGSLTTGVVINGRPEDRGVRLALHSMVGFLGGALGGPIVGFVLDNFGGQSSHIAWFLSFLCLGLGSLFSSFVLKYYYLSNNKF